MCELNKVEAMELIKGIVKDYYELNNLVRELNEKTAYGVSVVRVFKKSFIEKLFGK